MNARPPLLFVASFGAGLATGLLHFGAPLGATAALIALAAAAGGRALAGLAAAAALLGALHGEIARAQDRLSCAARLPPGDLGLAVRLLEPVPPAGGLVEVRPLGAACIGAVVARWPSRAEAPAGVEARIRARWVSRPSWTGRAGGTLVVGVMEGLRGKPSLGARLRTGVARAVRELYGARAGVVEALILGGRGGIEPALRDAFAWSGLVHLLSISGFHVGLIAGWLVLVARLLRLSRPRALAVASLGAVAYVAALGWPPPATRAAALAVLGAACQVRQRNVQPDPLLALTCLTVLLVDPWAVVDLGAWLSAAALWGATTCSRWTDRVWGRRFWVRCTGASAGATLATAPITSAALGTVAPVGIALNLAAIPLAALAVPGVFASLLAMPWAPALARALAAGSGFLLHLLELLAWAGARLPGGHLVTEASPAQALPWLLALAALLWGLRGRTTAAEALRRWGWVGVVALWIPLGLRLGPAAHGDGGLALHFLDVGQGDGIVLRTPHGRFVVIDAGPRTERDDAGRRVVIPFLARARATGLAALVVSHAHADHVGGAAAVLDRFPTGVVIEPGMPFPDPAYYRFLDAVAADDVPWHPGRPGDRFTVDGVGFTVLHPDLAWPGRGEDLNEDSIVLLVEYGRFRALLPGDAGFPAEAWLRGRVGEVDLLKVGHHGSRGSTGDAWLDELRPRAAVVSVGPNTYGHPSPATLERLRAHGVDLRRTDRGGRVDVTTDGRTMTVTSKGSAKTYQLRERPQGVRGEP